MQSAGERERPNPDELLKTVKREVTEESHGKMKIFLGYSAGVGKTYTMLEEAQHLKKEGVDVVIGYVETHGRGETEDLAKGLETVPRRKVSQAGIVVEEMDLDAILARHPQLVLVDELAHTNAQGSRHPKRYMDVEEMLQSGIDIFTTLNVQHLESVNDTVAKITGVIVREKVPDGIVDEAYEIKIVDLPPEELLKRLREGKVYVPDEARRAVSNFFNEGNLIALRELTLRRAAERVDEEMVAYMRNRAIPGPWAAGERLLVCVGDSNQLNERIVRTGRRLADEMKAEWQAIYVQTPAQARFSRKAKEVPTRAMELAKSLGAKTSTTFGVSIADEVVRYARKNNITKIIVGRPVRSRLREIIFATVVDQLVHSAGSIDIFVISERFPTREPTESMEPSIRGRWRNYLYCLWLVIGISILSVPLTSVLSPTNLVMIYLIGVVIAALTWGLFPAVFTSAISVILFDYLFVPPRGSFSIGSSEYLITFAAFLVVGFAISFLVVRERDAALAAQTREEHTSTIYWLSADLAAAADRKEVVEAAVKNIRRIFNWDAAVLLPFEDGLVLSYASAFSLNEKEVSVANWSFANRTVSGFGTDTLTSAAVRCYPLATTRGTSGVLAVRPTDEQGVSPEQDRLLRSFASQVAIAIERVQLAEKIIEADVCPR
jgi:two-component system sensor histidine kinase KdpD